MKIKSNEPVMGWKKGGEKMSQFKIYVGVLLVAMLFLAGCTSKPTYSDTENTASSGENDTVSQASAPSKQESKPEVSTLSIWSASMDNWDADPEVDGIKVTIQPENKEGKLVRAEGLLNARVYDSDYDSKFKTVKTDLIKEWNNIVIDSDYGFLGKEIRLEFDEGFVPDSTVYLEIDFIYDGKTYMAVKDTVFDFS